MRTIRGLEKKGRGVVAAVPTPYTPFNIIYSKNYVYTNDEGSFYYLTIHALLKM
jgi:hypothetical protein